MRNKIFQFHAGDLQKLPAGKNTILISACCLCFSLCIFINSKGQTTPSLNVTNIFNEQAIVYNNDSFLHTAWKPILYKDSTVAAGTNKWFNRKFFHEHLLQVNKPGFNLNGDLIFDEYIGNSSRFVETPMLNTRGYEVTGNISDKFYFETSFYENQGRFGGYVDSFIRRKGVIPGQNGYKNIGDGKGFDFSYSSSRLVYLAGKHVMFDLGYGKNFIGDGYRSILLSDWSFNYPYLHTALTFGKFQYNMMWSQYISDRNPQYNNKAGYYRKWSNTYMIDWRPTNRLSLSLFETVMWPDQDSLRNKDMSPWIASPIIFVHGMESPGGIPNNVITGLNAKYRILKETHIYGQFAVNSKGNNNAPGNRFAAQAGVRSGDVFGLKNLSGLIEFNMAQPYMYATNSLNTNYAHNNQSMAHPAGANFREGLMLVEYAYRAWRFRLEGFVTKYGADSIAGANFGQNIFKKLDTRSIADNTSLGQGLPTNIYFADARISYVINPVSNLRIESGFTFRNEKNSKVSFEDRIIYIGVRMSFRRLIYDF